jgi:hypothetical protein
MTLLAFMVSMHHYLWSHLLIPNRTEIGKVEIDRLELTLTIFYQNVFEFHEVHQRCGLGKVLKESRVLIKKTSWWFIGWSSKWYCFYLKNPSNPNGYDSFASKSDLVNVSLRLLLLLSWPFLESAMQNSVEGQVRRNVERYLY